MKKKWISFWSLKTREDLERVIRLGAGASAYCAAVTLVVIAIQYYPPAAAIDALAFGVLAWFILQRSRVACGLAVLLFLGEQLYKCFDPMPGDHPGGLSVWLLIVFVQAFRASLKYHAPVTAESSSPSLG